MKALVCGGRDHEDKMAVWYVLDSYGPPEITEIISGMARGPDMFAAEWARKFGFTLHKFPADWDQYKKAAGPIRNQQMLDEGKPDIVIAFPTKNSRGTWDMVRRAKKAGIETKVYK